MITADLKDERIPRRNRLSEPAFQQEHFDAILFCLEIFKSVGIAQTDCLDCPQMFSTLFVPSVALSLYWCPLSIVPEAFLRGLSIKGQAMQWSTHAFNSFKPPHCTAVLLVSSSNCPQSFFGRASMSEVWLLLDSFVKINFLKKDLPSFLPRCQKSANACPRLYLLPAIKSQGSARNLGEREKPRDG